MPGGNSSEFFVRNNHNYNLHAESEQLLPNVNTVFKVQNSISYFASVIRNSIPFELRKASSYQIFRSEKKTMVTDKLPLQIMQKLHRKVRIHQYIFLVGQIYS